MNDVRNFVQRRSRRNVGGIRGSNTPRWAAILLLWLQTGLVHFFSLHHLHNLFRQRSHLTFQPSMHVAYFGLLFVVVHFDASLCFQFFLTDKSIDHCCQRRQHFWVHLIVGGGVAGGVVVGGPTDDEDAKGRTVPGVGQLLFHVHLGQGKFGVDDCTSTTAGGAADFGIAQETGLDGKVRCLVEDGFANQCGVLDGESTHGELGDGGGDGAVGFEGLPGNGHFSRKGRQIVAHGAAGHAQVEARAAKVKQHDC